MFFPLADAATPDSVPSLSSLLTLVPSIGATGAAILFGWLMLTGRVVRKAELDKAEKRADDWQRIALEAMQSGRAGAHVAEKAAEVAREAVKGNRNAHT